MPNTVQLTKDGQPIFPVTDASVVTGISDVAKSGDYDDLDNKPTIPAAQVQTDWNASSGMGVLLNKPNLATVATSGSYNDLSNKPTIPTVPTISTNIAADASSDTKTASPKAVKTYVDNHMTNVSAVTSQQDGTIVITLTNGDTITVDLNHNHEAYYSKVAETTQPQGGFLPDVVYNLGTLTGTVTFALAAAVSGNVNHYYWTFTAGSTAPTVTWPSSNFAWADGTGPTVAANKYYEISVLNGKATFLEV